MKSVIILCLILGLALAKSSSWESFKSKYNRQYANPDEEHYRYKVFQSNLKRAGSLQKKEMPGGATFGVTKFSDLTEEEFRSKYLLPKDFSATYNPRAEPTTKFGNARGIAPNKVTFDWSTTGATTPVYNQGECGSCWAFSATETIESYWYLSGHTMVPLSIEQIVDCDTTCYGCGGGWPYLAYQYIEGAKGQDTGASYPYTAEGGNSGTCAFNAANVAAQVMNYTSVAGETGLYAVASTSGPISVCVDASSWSAYTGGILTQCTSNVDHCVQLTGYANYGATGDYWIVRNSWGTDWGISGFIWIAIGQDLCAIGDYATVVQA